MIISILFLLGCIEDKTKIRNNDLTNKLDSSMVKEIKKESRLRDWPMPRNLAIFNNARQLTSKKIISYGSIDSAVKDMYSSYEVNFTIIDSSMENPNIIIESKKPGFFLIWVRKDSVYYYYNADTCVQRINKCLGEIRKMKK